MTDSVHPTPDELADLHAGLLTGPERESLRVHVDSCVDCTAELAALDEVASMLAASGAEPVTMPTDVADDLDRALAAASRERAEGVSSLATKRDQRDQRDRSPGRSRWVLIAGAAAAAVFVIGAVGLDGLRSTDDSDDSAGGDSAADSGSGVSELQHDPSAPEGAGGANSGDSKSLPSVSADTLPAFATKLAAKGNSPVTARTSTMCAADLPPQPSTRTLYADVTWDGRSAVVVVDPAAETATVFGCGTRPEPLFSTSY